MYRKVTALFIFSLLLSSCKLANISFSHPYEKIITLPGPEDMVLDTVGSELSKPGSKPLIIISCTQRRKTDDFISGIQQLDLNSGEVSTFIIIGMPDSIKFNPHGIDIGTYKSRKILWVINHEDEKKRQTILRFNIMDKKLVYDTVFIDKSIISPNDICDGGNGTFYFTNDASSRHSGFEVLLKIKGGSIVYYNGKGNYQIFNKKFSYPNGVIKFKNQLYFSSSRQNKIFGIKLNTDGSMMKDSISLVTKGTSWDNFSVNGDYLICTSHSRPMKFLKHRKNEKYDSPCQVYSINPVTKTKGIVYHTNGEAISAGSAAIFYRGYLYMSQVFDSYILKVNLHNY